MTLALIREHRLAQINNGTLIAALVLEVAKEFEAGRLDRQGFIEALVATDLLGHDAAVRIASQFVTALREAEGVEGILELAEFDTGASYGRAIGVVRDLDQARALIDMERDYSAEFWRILQANAIRADRFTKNAGRNTVIASAEASGRGWRRVSDGDPCAFCAMLVSRGPAYTSAETAGLKRKFHNRCGCSVVEVTGTWTPTTEEQRYIDLYDQAAAACDADGAPRTADNIMQRMRQGGSGIVNDAPKPKTQTGGSGGGRPPAAGVRAGGGTEDNDDWVMRQRRLEGDSFTANGERLEPAEVQFVERMLALNEALEWIKTGSNGSDEIGTLPTNDFFWRSRGGIPVEHKAIMEDTPLDLTHATRQLRKAMDKNRRTHVVDRVILDLGERSLPNQLRESLRARDTALLQKMNSLWVIHSGGIENMFGE